MLSSDQPIKLMLLVLTLCEYVTENNFRCFDFWETAKETLVWIAIVRPKVYDTSTSLAFKTVILPMVLPSL